MTENCHLGEGEELALHKKVKGIGKKANRDIRV